MMYEDEGLAELLDAWDAFKARAGGPLLLITALVAVFGIGALAGRVILP